MSSSKIGLLGLSNISHIGQNGSHIATTRIIDTETVVTACFYVFISFTAVFGNLLVMVAVLTTHNLKFSSNYLLANLALADFLQGALSLPLRLYELLKPGLDLKAFCPIAIPISILFGGTSNLNILFISVERLVAIRWPYLYYTHVTTERIIAVILFGWISVGSLALCPALGWGQVKFDSLNATFCRFPSFLTKKYIILLYLFIHVIPIVVVIFLYGFLLRISRSHARKIHAQEIIVVGKKSCKSQLAKKSDLKCNANGHPNIRKQRQTTRQVKAVKTVSVVVGFFIVLVLPIITIDVIEMLGGPKAPIPLIKLTVCMIYANQSVNVFIYAGFNSDYRRSFKRIVSQIMTFLTRRVRSG